jgi:ribosomal protein S18 acetylase RimI-like enzyme
MTTFEQLSRAFRAASDMFGTPGAVSGERPGLRYSGVGSPIAGFNRLMATRMHPATVDEDLDAAIADMDRFPVISAWIPPGVEPADLAKRFVKRGFVADADESLPAMSAPLAGLPAFDVPPGVTWSTVDDDASFDAMIDVMSRGFGMPDDLRPFLEHALRPQAGPVPELATFVVHLDGVPASTSLAAVVGEAVVIYNVATLPESRGRGLGALATRLAMRHGIEHGAEVAVLEASAMGYPIYRRLGFEEVGRYQVLVRRHKDAI